MVVAVLVPSVGVGNCMASNLYEVYHFIVSCSSSLYMSCWCNCKVAPLCKNLDATGINSHVGSSLYETKLARPHPNSIFYFLTASIQSSNSCLMAAPPMPAPLRCWRRPCRSMPMPPAPMPTPPPGAGAVHS